MRCRASGKVFEFVMANDQSRMFRTQLRASHARVTIGVGEINISADKHVLIIRAARRQNQETQNRKFDSNRGVAKHPLISNPQSQIRNPKLRPARLHFVTAWQPRKLSGLGPPGFEPGTKGL